MGIRWCTRTLCALLKHNRSATNPFTPSLISGRRYRNWDNKGLNSPSSKPNESKKWWIQRKKLLLALFAGCSTSIYLLNQEIIPYTNRNHFVLISAESEKRMWEARFKVTKQFGLQGRMLDADHPNSLRVSSIAQNLIKALEEGISQIAPDFTYDQFKIQNMGVELRLKRRAQPFTKHLENLNWEVVVADLTPLIDVLCTPAGKILVSNGVLYLQDDAQLAALIAHRMGHMVARHFAEGMNKEIWKPIIERLLCCILAPHVVYSMKFLKERNYSSAEIEREANYIGLMLMAAAGYDPSAAVITVEKLRLVSQGLQFRPCMLRSEVHSQTDAMEKAMELYRAKNEVSKLEY